MRVDESITLLPKTASVTIKKLQGIGIHTLFDLINYIPTRYKDYQKVSPVASLQTDTLFEKGQGVVFATIVGTVKKTTQRFLKAGLSMQVITLDDGTGSVDCIWFRQPYILTNLKPGMEIIIAGAVRRFGYKVQLYVDEYEVTKTNTKPLHAGRLVPVYSEKRGLSSRMLREKIFLALQIIESSITDPIPEKLSKKYTLMDESQAYRQVHFPATLDEVARAKRRLAFDELFTIQLTSTLVKKEWEKEKVGHSFPIQTYKDKIGDFINALPFTLTKAQNRAIDEILSDLKKNSPMNRLLQGDVGSGKTVIAALCAYASYLAGFSTLIMAPTEILAQQHLQTLKKMFSLKFHPTVSLRTSSNKGGSADIVIGTHALITSKLDFANVGLVVIDEQHKFGVTQRAALKQKGIDPHLLTMTATPIPRTVCLALYGELSLSIIDEMPPGRQKIKTYVVPPIKRSDSYVWLRKQIQDTRAQIFIVCPLIEESEHETMSSVKAVTKEYETLKKIFSTSKIALLHGRMKAAEKEEIMKDFKSGKTTVLIATPVVEVGVDVPNATIMVIEGAERYGLAQLHQLRGRVGRGKKQSYCLLFTSQEESKAIDRLNYFTSTSSGFKLAEYDLMHRGAGDLYGMRQHGASDLVLFSLGDKGLIEETRECCTTFIDNYNLMDFLELQRRVNKLSTHKIAKD